MTTTTTETAPNHATALIPASEPVSMLTPEQAGAFLQLSSGDLLDAVNRGLLAAYDLDGRIRFRASDVFAVLDRYSSH